AKGGRRVTSVSTGADPVEARAERPPFPLALLFAPDRSMTDQARIGRARTFLIFAWVCSLLLALSVAWRVDATHQTLAKLEQSGELQTVSDGQLADETRKAERIAQVLTVAKGALGPPLALGLASTALLGLSWFFRGRIRGRGVIPVASVTLVP